MRDGRVMATSLFRRNARRLSKINFASCFRNKQTGGSSLTHIVTKKDADKDLVVLLARRLPRHRIIRVRIHA